MNQDVSFKDHCIVSCGILRPELTFLADSGYLDAHKVVFTPPGLHVLPDELEKQLSRALNKIKEQCPSQGIIVIGHTSTQLRHILQKAGLTLKGKSTFRSLPRPTKPIALACHISPQTRTQRPQRTQSLLRKGYLTSFTPQRTAMH